MKYSELVSSNKNFQSSVNLQFDLNKQSKIDSYIPTQQSVSILKKYLDAIYKNSSGMENSTVLIGPYGRGKSHLLLVISAIVGGTSTGVSAECLNGLVKRISKVDKEAALLADRIIKRNTPLLTVLINSNHIDLNQAFIIALRDALNRADLNDIFPETYFESALNAVTMWEKEYPDTIKVFKKKLSLKKITLPDFKMQLMNCTREAYNIFYEIYPLVTSGTQFNPMQNTDVIYLYDTVAEEIAKRGYSGYFVIFDEFSKFLESTSIKPDMQNMKIIQDFAELCARGIGHFCCVTHKDILEYSSSAGFKTVDGRLSKVRFVASEEQSFELVANAINHNRRFTAFYNAHADALKEIGANAYRTGAFSSLSEESYNEILIKKCFPMHPLAVLALIDVSEQVGQNERSLFSFLSQSGENTFNEFLAMEREDDSLDLLTADTVFDYFSDQFMTAVFNKRIYHNWAKAVSALKQVTDENQRKVIKAISLINILTNDRLVPASNCIKAFLNMSDDTFGGAVDALTNSHIITLLRDGKYAFLTANGVDIQKDVRNSIEQRLVKLDRPSALQSISPVSHFLPRQFNAERFMLRYFNTYYMEAADYLAYTGSFAELMGEADGLVVYIIRDENSDVDELKRHIADTNAAPNIVVCISGAWCDDQLLLEYSAACLLEKRGNADSHFMEELQVYKNDRFKSIQEMIQSIYSPSNPDTVFFSIEREFEDISTPMQLNRELSRVCESVYYRTPLINNEMINKNHPNAPIKKARASIIDYLFKNKESFEPIEGLGPDATTMRATLVVNKLNEQSEAVDNNLNEALNVIRNFVVEAENRNVSFSEIYDVLTSAPYGMRRGVIPIYIAYVMRGISERIVLRLKDTEQELDGEIFNAIDDKKRTADYSFAVDSGTAEMNAYIDGVIKLFGSEGTADLNKRKIAVSSMQSWYRNLPKFARFFERGYNFDFNCTKALKDFRALLSRYEINCHDTLFIIIPKTFGTDNYNDILNKLSEYKEISDGFMSSLKNYLIESIEAIINEKYNYNGTFVSVMKNWYAKLNDRTKRNVFDSDTNALLSFVAQLNTYDEQDVVSDLAQRISTIPITEWSESTVENFLDSISRSIEKVYSFDSADDNNRANDISVTLSFGGKSYGKTLSGTPIEGMAETLLNNIQANFEDYGDAITPQERIAVLLEALKHEIDNM